MNVQPYSDVNKGDIIQYRSIKAKVAKIRAYPKISNPLAHEDYRKIVLSAKTCQEALKSLLEKIITRSHLTGYWPWR